MPKLWDIKLKKKKSDKISLQNIFIWQVFEWEIKTFYLHLLPVTTSPFFIWHEQRRQTKTEQILDKQRCLLRKSDRLSAGSPKLVSRTKPDLWKYISGHIPGHPRNRRRLINTNSLFLTALTYRAISLVAPKKSQSCISRGQQRDEIWNQKNLRLIPN